jgi:hypothetical protein
VRNGLDGGFPEDSPTDLMDDPASIILFREYPHVSESRLDEIQGEMDEFARQVTAMVGSLFGASYAV